MSADPWNNDWEKAMSIMESLNDDTLECQEAVIGLLLSLIHI